MSATTPTVEIALVEWPPPGEFGGPRLLGRLRHFVPRPEVCNATSWARCRLESDVLERERCPCWGAGSAPDESSGRSAYGMALVCVSSAVTPRSVS